MSYFSMSYTQVKMEFENAFFLGGSMLKPEYPEKALGERREQTKHSTHIWHQAGY